MKLYEAIEYAINNDGIEVICENRFVNYLTDLQAFETPAIKRVIATIVHDGYGEQLHNGLANDSYQLTFNDVSYQLTHTVGFQEDIVQFVLDSLLYATHKISIEPSLEYNTNSTAETSHKYSNGMDLNIRQVKEPISKEDIEDFFNLEAEATQAKWEATMKLSTKDRIRKRKAIKDVYLDENFGGMSEDNHNMFKVSVVENLADFKEGESLILHKETSMHGIKCRLNSFDGDDAIILELLPPNIPSDLDAYYDVPLLLDKDKVDLRQHVYYPFLFSLPASNDNFWKELILNSCPQPTFENKEKCVKFLAETESSSKLSLLLKQKEAILNSMQAKDYYLIQGPPGTGKSFVLGIIMREEIFHLKHNVIVIGPNHMAINNAMVQLLKLVPQCLALKVGPSYNAPTSKVLSDGEEYGITNIPRLDVCIPIEAAKMNLNWLVGLTPHSLYTSRARGLECDTLIIDEAGQMTIPLALMGMIKAKKVIFAGDHKQLPPIVSSEKVKPELRQSAFQALISGNNCTMLDTSFRMCEPICDFVSELFYDGHLHAMKQGHSNALICNNPLYSFDSPVILHEIDDDGEQVSDKEAAFIADTIAKFLSLGVSAEEIGVLSPFRAQAANIRRSIRKHIDISKEDSKNIVSETIDKMQGQEREVIIYSLVSGNMMYMKEMAEFLYNPNKMNVAFSRAKSKLIIVGSLSKIGQLDMPDYPHINKMLNSKHSKTVIRDSV